MLINLGSGRSHSCSPRFSDLIASFSFLCIVEFEVPEAFICRPVECLLADSTDVALRLEAGMELVWATEEGTAFCASRAASSGLLVMPSMNSIKRSPYGSGEIGEINFLS